MSLIVASLLFATPADLYLPPNEAHGFTLCLNPASKQIAQARMRAWDEATRVSTIEMVADLDFLHELLRTTYSGYAEFAQQQDMRVEDFFARWKKRLLKSRQKSIRLDDALMPELLEMKRRVPDNHLQVRGLSSQLHRGPCTAAVEYFSDGKIDTPDALSSCTVELDPSECRTPQWKNRTLRVADRLNLASGTRSRVIVTTIAGAGQHVTVHCPKSDTRLARRSPLRAKSVDDDLLYRSEPFDDTIYIQIRRFGGTEEQLRQLETLASDYETHSQYERIVFDLRGNGGGNDRYMYDWISKAKNGTWDSGSTLKVNGPVGPCWAWNRAVMKGANAMGLTEAEYSAELDALRRQWESFNLSWPYVSGLITDKSTKPFEGQIYVVVDRNTGSSGESAAYALKKALNATLVGERTAGLMEHGDVLNFVLPNTGTVWQLATKRNFFDEPLEEVGLAVDLYVDVVDASASQLVQGLRASER